MEIVLNKTEKIEKERRNNILTVDLKKDITDEKSKVESWLNVRL